MTGVEMFRKILDYGWLATTLEFFFAVMKREEVERGQVLVKPGSITPHTKFNLRGLHPQEG